jgi:hypothetical protein
MEKIKIESEVPKELHELVSVLVEMIVLTKEQLKDGFQLDKDLGPILALAVSKLPLAVEGMEKISEEIKQDLPGAIKAISIESANLLSAFLVKKEQA